MCNLGHTGIFTEELLRFKHKVPLFWCLWISPAPPNSSRNMWKHGYLLRFQSSGHYGKISGVHLITCWKALLHHTLWNAWTLQLGSDLVIVINCYTALIWWLYMGLLLWSTGISTVFLRPPRSSTTLTAGTAMRLWKSLESSGILLPEAT